jgi:uncharacterized protein (TIGR04141 family)
MTEFKKVTLYKIKAGVEFSEFLKGDLATYDRFESEDNFDGYIKFENAGGGEKTEDAIPWLKFLNSGFAEKKYRFSAHNRFPRAIMALRIKQDGSDDSHYVAAFGQHGDSFLDKDQIVYDFGIKVGMNICHDEGLKRVQTTAHESISRQTERQASTGASLGVFGINSEAEFLRTISGSVKPAYREAIDSFKGKDSILIKFPKDDEISWKYLAGLCTKLEERYLSNDYQSTAFKSYDTLRHENDPVVIESLDNLLCAAIIAKQFDRIHLAPPEFVEGDDTSYAYVEIKDDDDAPATYEDLRIGDLVDAPRRRLKGLTSDTLKRWPIFRFDSEQNKTFKIWNAYRCLVAEVDLNGRTFVLSNGQWREISEELKATVETYFAENEMTVEADFLPSAVNIWSADKGENREEVYNLKAAEACEELYLLDKAKLTVAGQKKYEVCDLLHAEKHIVHVKRYSSGAASISHLFTQGKFYAHAFATDQQCRADITTWIDENAEHPNVAKNKVAFTSIIPAKNSDVDEKDYTVIFCILHDRDAFDIADLPFMSRYELMLSHRFLTQDRKFKVGVALRNVQLNAVAVA